MKPTCWKTKSRGKVIQRISEAQSYVIFDNTGGNRIECHVSRTNRIVPVVIAGTQRQILVMFILCTQLPYIDILPAKAYTITSTEARTTNTRTKRWCARTSWRLTGIRY